MQSRPWPPLFARPTRSAFSGRVDAPCSGGSQEGEPLARAGSRGAPEASLTEKDPEKGPDRGARACQEHTTTGFGGLSMSFDPVRFPLPLRCFHGRARGGCRLRSAALEEARAHDRHAATEVQGQGGDGTSEAQLLPHSSP
jgi:hypothetical protein